MKKNKLTLSILAISLGYSSLFASFSAKQIDDMVEKLNYQEKVKINTDVKDPFDYPVIVKKVELKKSKDGKNIIVKKKIKKVEKKIIINYQGLIINKALINNKTYKVGDYFKNSKIIKITPNKLYLKQNDFIFVVNKKENKIKIKEN
jgi:hypothetical protein